MKQWGIWVGVLILLSFTPNTFAQSGITHSESFWGLVTIGGTNAPAATVIRAVTSDYTSSITTTVAGRYGGQLISEDKLLIQSATNGAAISFTITTAPGCSGTDTVRDNITSGVTTEKNLTFSGSCGTTTTTTTTTSSTGSGGGAGGSSAGGGATGGAGTENIAATKTKFYSSIADGETVSLAVDVPEIGIVALRILFEEGGSNIAITVNSLISRPGELESPSDKVYQYLEIKLSDNADLSQIRSVDIDFKVPNTWVIANNVDETQIVLFRWTNAWNELSTIKDSKDNTYIYYTATSPGLSYFAIGVSSKAPSSETPQITQPTTPEPPTTTPGVPEVAGKEGSKKIALIIFLAIIVLGLAGYVVYLKKKK